MSSRNLTDNLYYNGYLIVLWAEHVIDARVAEIKP